MHHNPFDFAASVLSGLEPLVAREFARYGEPKTNRDTFQMANRHSHSGHSHHHIEPKTGNSRVIGAIAINMFLTLVQIVGGLISGSLALIANPLHNLMSAIELAIALFFVLQSPQRPADSRMRLGYGRARVRVRAITDLVNYTAFAALSVYLVYEGVTRFFDPEPVKGWTSVGIVGIVLVVNLLPYIYFFALLRTSDAKAEFADAMTEAGLDIRNIRAKVLSDVGDTLGSVAVIVAGMAVILFDWTWVDSTVAIMFSVYILWRVKSGFGETVRVLILGLDPEEIAFAIENNSSVVSVRHIHLRGLQEREAEVTAHLVITQEEWDRADDIGVEVEQLLMQQFGLRHVTIEIECGDHT